jgi:hypothetical protein
MYRTPATILLEWSSRRQNDLPDALGKIVDCLRLGGSTRERTFVTCASPGMDTPASG